MAIALGILFPLVMVLHPLFLHLIPLVLLCISGLFANLIQALCFVYIWPISKNTYRKINRVVKELDWWVLVCLIDWWAGVKVYIKRHAAKESPETDDAVEKWCTDIFAAKDALLDKHTADQTFGDQGLQAIGCYIFGMSTCVWGSKVQLGPLFYTACIQYVLPSYLAGCLRSSAVECFHSCSVPIHASLSNKHQLKKNNSSKSRNPKEGTTANFLSQAMF